MAGIWRRARRKVTAILGRRGFSVFSLGFVLLVICARSTEKLFESAHTATIKGQISQASGLASSGYKRFKHQSASEWHWKFQLLFADMLLYNGDTLQAQLLLNEPPTAKFPHFLPVYDKL